MSEEDVSKFLSEVRELGDRRVEEDEARSRELEEKILRDRAERQARRAERARSISPQKSSPANTPPPSAHRTSITAQTLNLDSSPILEPPVSSQAGGEPESDPMYGRNSYSTSPTKENESPFDAENKRASGEVSPTRRDSIARGLNWQRRPNSQASNGPRTRPLSMVAAENAARSSTGPSEPTSATETISRDQIAQNLLSKDPAWFRQTTDRGASSGAYRKSQVEDEERMDMSSMKAQLPGMSRDQSSEPVKDDRISPSSPAFRPSIRSPLPQIESQKLDPPADIERQQSPTSPERSSLQRSPTRGMGGFVQSAMNRRSDSVSKRWSVQSTTGLQRADSIASNPNNFDLTNRTGGSGAKPRPYSMMRESSTMDSASLPDSTGDQHKENKEEVIKDEEESISAKISNSLKLGTKTSPDPQESDKVTPPDTPSRGLDQRRWSPTKSSWLESALNKPESPKPKHTPPPTNQPAWMAEIAKAKAQKAANPSTDISRSRSPTVGHKHEVNIGGLMRSTAPGLAVKPSTLGSVSTPAAAIGTTTRTAFGSLRSTSQTSSTVDGDAATEKSLKPKPNTLPKKDFRANLKSRQPPPTAGDSDSKPEFKSVFGSLRKTTTQNYVPPDELKNNILRGKAALNITGGPKKTERKDEFKDAILAKKKEFQKAQVEGRGISRNNSSASDQPVPEALVKSMALGQSTIRRDSASPETNLAGDPPRRPSVVSKSSASPLVTPKRELPNPLERRDSVPDTTASNSIRPTIGAKWDSASGMSTANIESKPPPVAILPRESGAPGKLPGKLGGSSLANRFNPALAGLLARGPPGMASGGSGSSGGSAPRGSSSADGGNNEPGAGPKLTHMTKGRARGPKRKAPTSVAAATTPASVQASKEAEKKAIESQVEEQKPAPIAALKSPAAVVVDTPSKISEPSQQPKPEKISLVDLSKKSLEQREVPEKSPTSPRKGHARSPSKVSEQIAALAARSRSSSPTKGRDESEQNKSQPSSPRKLDIRRKSIFLQEPPQLGPKSPEGEKAAGVKSPKSDIKPVSTVSSPGLQKPEVMSPPPEIFSRPIASPAPLSPKKQIEDDKVGPEPSVPVQPGTPRFGGRPLPEIPPPAVSTPTKTIPSPLPLENKSSRPVSRAGVTSPPPALSPMRSPTKQAVEINNALNEFFGPERPTRNYHVDTAEILMSKPNASPPDIQTLSTDLFQITPDGKKQPIRADNVRVLFEREMYLCTHTFNNEVGKKMSEVYFWAGDEVPVSAVEDASIFVSREARAFGGKVINVQQGKETPEFLAALGGIVITRRGSSNKYDSLAPHMLCGRRFLGQIVFDEIDFTPAALCSGFAYLITSAGKCYLWKGKGSGVDELSCARLIGMDYALSGEMQEVDDGHEPATFWDLFDGGSKATSADHWRLKPNYDKYCSRLFLSDAGSKKQIEEMSPFVQRDLKSTCVYVLDAFFELYIIVGARSKSQYASFHNALDFAQEYAILAAGMEDRPFVPISTVVLEGIPKDMKSVFRKWRDADSPTVTNPPGNGMGLRRGRSLRIMPLNQALQALNE